MFGNATDLLLVGWVIRDSRCLYTFSSNQQCCWLVIWMETKVTKQRCFPPVERRWTSDIGSKCESSCKQECVWVLVNGLHPKSVFQNGNFMHWHRLVINTMIIQCQITAQSNHKNDTQGATSDAQGHSQLEIVMAGWSLFSWHLISCYTRKISWTVWTFPILSW